MHNIADLHTHTRCSDGALTTEELISRAQQAGISILSVTDHDSVDGVARAIAEAKPCGITVLPGIEMSAKFNDREIHILGYCFDYEHQELRKCVDLFRDQRVRRMERMVKKLNSMNIPLKVEDVMKQAGNAVVCRPHIALAMVEQKLAGSYYEVFQKFINDIGPAYEQKPDFPLEKALKLIADAGGLSFLAHPKNSYTSKELVSIIKLGIDGIETVHPCHTEAMQQFYRGITNEYYLLECGGSDFHGGLRGDDRNFGQFGISLEGVDRMQQRIRKRFL